MPGLSDSEFRRWQSGLHLRNGREQAQSSKLNVTAKAACKLRVRRKYTGQTSLVADLSHNCGGLT